MVRRVIGIYYQPEFENKASAWYRSCVFQSFSELTRYIDLHFTKVWFNHMPVMKIWEKDDGRGSVGVRFWCGFI